METALEASDVGIQATGVIKDLEAKGLKPAEIMAICLAASKIAESLIITQSMMGVVAKTMKDLFAK